MAKKAKAKPGTMAELAEIYPVIKAIDVRVERIEGTGKASVLHYQLETVFVKPLAVEQLGSFAAALAPISAGIGSAPNWIIFAAEHKNEVVNAIAAAIDWNPKVVAKMHAADFLDVFAAVMEANQDFLTRLLGSLVFDGQATTGAGSNGAGTGRSNSSAPAEPPSQENSH